MGFDYDDPRDADFTREAIRDALVKLSTAIPALIVSYDAATRRATVQPAFKLRAKTGQLVRAPQLGNVPVAFPGGAGGGLTWALAAGDEVILVCAQRRIARWLERGGEVDPWDGAELGDDLPPLFRLDDAIAIPVPLSDPIVAARSSAATDGVTLGAEGVQPVKLGADDAASGVAFGDVVDSNLDAIVAKITKLELWASAVGALPAVPIPYVPFPVPPLTPPSVILSITQSAKVKTK